ncbi:MAG: hypothetical protein ACKVU1_17145 [bacterium]
MDERDPMSPTDDDEPLSEIASLVESPSPRFLTRIRDRIHRRVLGNQLAELSFGPVSTVFVEFLTALFAAVAGTKKRDRS